MRKTQTKSLAYAAILIAFGILIPLIMPVKLVIGPASYTLGSHVPIFLALFLSLPIAILVALGTTIGFLLAGFPIVIVLRALSHLGFVLVAGLLLKKNPRVLEKAISRGLFALGINVIHGIAEFIIVYILTVGPATESSYVWSLLGLVGLGTLVHGMVDFYLAFYLWRFLSQKVGINFSLQK